MSFYHGQVTHFVRDHLGNPILWVLLTFVISLLLRYKPKWHVLTWCSLMILACGVVLGHFWW